MIDGPSEAQLRYLDRLKYAGAPPQTKAEASFLIDGRKSRRNSSRLERELTKFRQKAQREWFKEERYYCQTELQQARSSGGAIVGFRIFVGKRCDKAKRYHEAFLPIQVALKHRGLLPPYKGICQHELCECEFECVLDSDRLNADTRMVVAPDKVTTVGKATRKRRPLLTLFILGVVIYLVYRVLNMDALRNLSGN